MIPIQNVALKSLKVFKNTLKSLRYLKLVLIPKKEN